MSRAAEHDFENPLWYDNNESPKFARKLAVLHVLLYNIHHYITVVFTSVEKFIRKRTVK
jgi:hypothetical protein